MSCGSSLLRQITVDLKLTSCAGRQNPFLWSWKLSVSDCILLEIHHHYCNNLIFQLHATFSEQFLFNFYVLEFYNWQNFLFTLATFSISVRSSPFFLFLVGSDTTFFLIVGILVLPVAMIGLVTLSKIVIFALKMLRSLPSVVTI